MKILRRIFTIVISATIIIGVYSVVTQKSQVQGIVQAFGPIEVTFPSIPLFNETNWFPGKSVNKTLSVKNTQVAVDQTVAVKAINHTDSGSNQALSAALWLLISENGTPLYGTGSPTGPRHLSDFYMEQMVILKLIKSGETKQFTFSVTMDPSSGNLFQAGQTQFDLNFLSETSFSPNPGPLNGLSSLRGLSPLQPLQRLLGLFHF